VSTIRTSDRVAVVDRGRLLALGSVHELIDAHGGPSELVLEHDSAPGSLTRTPVNDPIGQLSAAIALGGLRSATIQRPTLESVFLNLTGRSLRD
jgi:ABC-type multidrug transport system ATPase subunit